MANFGQQLIQRLGFGTRIQATGEIEEKLAGVTIDWSTVVAASTDTVIAPSFSSTATTPISTADQMANGYVRAGEKFLRYGTFLCRITGSSVATQNGKFAPYGSTTGLNGGSLLKTKGDMFPLNVTVFESDPHSDYCPVIVAGQVWKARLVQNGTGAANTLAGPTQAEIDAALSGIIYV